MERCDFIKIDVEWMELDVLQGTALTIERCRPVLYVENDRPAKSSRLIDCLQHLGYLLYWHTPTLFNPANYLGETENVFGDIVSLNMLCLPDRVTLKVNGLRPVVGPEPR
jgi:hypothetical protein